MPYERITVECYSGHRANERPVAFTFEGIRRTVQEVVDRWYEGGREPGSPETAYFKVLAADGRVFIIRYQSLFDAWSLLL